MKLRVLVIAALAGGIAVSAQAAPVATVNGMAIDNSQVQTVMAMSPGLAQEPNARDQVIQNLINMEVLAQYAQAHKLDQSPEVKERMALAKRQILANAAVQQYVDQHPVPEADIKTAYDNFVKTMGNKEYQVRHILVKTKVEADKIIADLKKGAKFSALAEKYSIDKASAAHGGELGWIVPGMVVPSFAQAVEGAKQGQVVGPVQTQFGYHIIEVQGMRKLTPPPYATMKDRIKAELEQQEAAKFVQAERAKAKIDISK